MSAIQPQVTGRILDLLRQAEDALAQAAHEGSHILREDPEPRTDSPWTTPDLPARVAQLLADTRNDLRVLRRVATEDYERANQIVHMRYAPCADCGATTHGTGAMECQYPKDHEEQS